MKENKREIRELTERRSPYTGEWIIDPDEEKATNVINPNEFPNVRLYSAFAYDIITLEDDSPFLQALNKAANGSRTIVDFVRKISQKQVEDKPQTQK